MNALEPATITQRRELAIGFASSICYFVVLLLLPAVCFPYPLVLLALGWFAFAVVIAALVIGLPLSLAGRAIAHHYQNRWVGLLSFLVIGGLTGYLSFGVYALASSGRFEPFLAFGPHSGAGVAIVMVIAGLCTMAGWATAVKYSRPTNYDDALEGLDFAELAELIRNARDADK